MNPGDTDDTAFANTNAGGARKVAAAADTLAQVAADKYAASILPPGRDTSTLNVEKARAERWSTTS